MIALLCFILIFCNYFIWYLYYCMELFLNGGNNSNIIKSLKEEIDWVFSSKARANYIKSLMGTFEEGYLGSFTYSKIREENLYDEVGKEVLPGPCHLFFTHFCPLILVPTGLLVILIENL